MRGIFYGPLSGMVREEMFRKLLNQGRDPELFFGVQIEHVRFLANHDSGIRQPDVIFIHVWQRLTRRCARRYC